MATPLLGNASHSTLQHSHSRSIDNRHSYDDDITTQKQTTGNRNIDITLRKSMSGQGQYDKEKKDIEHDDKHNENVNVYKDTGTNTGASIDPIGILIQSYSHMLRHSYT